MKLSKKTIATIIGVLIALGGIFVGAEIWFQGAENYESASRRSTAFKAILLWLGGLIGDKPLAVLFSSLMALVGFGVHKIGPYLPDEK